MFCLSFELHFLTHIVPIMHHLLPLFIFFFFPSFLLIHLSIHDKKGGSILKSISECIVISIWLMYTFVRGESHRGDAYTKGEKTFFFWKTLFCFDLFYTCTLVGFCILNANTSCIMHWFSVGHAYILMLLYCMFGWSFALLYDHCSLFHMTILVYDQVAHMFHIMFTWSHFTCYIILVLLSLDLLWGSNVFCVSVSDYRYICSKCITASRFRCEWVFPLFPNSRLSLEFVMGCLVME